MKCKILLLLPLMAAGLTACHDELEETVYSNLTDDTAFTSAENAQAAVDAMYAPLQAIYRDPMFQAADGVTDVCFDKGVSAFDVLNDEAIRTSTHLATCWDNFYQVASRANIVIDRVGGMDDALFESNESSTKVYDKSRMVAEAHFMRAYAYMQLTDLFYQVPLVTSSDVDVAAKLPFADIADIEATIETDLRAALSLPEKYATNDDGGRPTCGAARGFLVRLY
ncbi:MAG: RagB/SusD family nutrient uptake outer membrane protein, partial [Muribaculaceae bacterium]|nr:RagB/SusD family nutrient uptake outer membrane protein [Muribaculaceae bacterium]